MFFEDLDDGVDDFPADGHLVGVVVSGAFGGFDLEFLFFFIGWGLGLIEGRVDGVA